MLRFDRRQNFHLIFQNNDRRKLALNVDLPVIAANDWLAVHDLETGHDQGQIQVTLAAGTDLQIKRLMRLEFSEKLQENDKNAQKTPAPKKQGMLVYVWVLERTRNLI